jgi:nucleoid-associated protein YgaU
MIFANSRYANSTVAAVDKGGSDVAVIVPSAQKPFSFAYVNHQVITGERIENIAYQYYTDAESWWRIADANPEILFWDDITPGIVLRIPSI